MVKDGSTDDSGVLCYGYTRGNVRMTSVHEENRSLTEGVSCRIG